MSNNALQYIYLRCGVILWMMTQMTANNVGALLVIKAGEKKALAGIITERGGASILVLNPLKNQNLCVEGVVLIIVVQFSICNNIRPNETSLSCLTDYLRKIIVQGRSSKTTKVGDIMTEEVSSRV
jgi:hypothetical protein